ncbi:MAG: hypothetical protein AAF711_13535 [Planctomycetota bacterium]
MPEPQEQPAKEASSGAPAASPVDTLLRLCLDADRRLLVFGLVVFGMAAFCTVLAATDSRVLDGANVWFKPIKFQLSLGIFLLTLAAIAAAASGAFIRSPIGRITVWTAIATSGFEIVWITYRAATAERSHYADNSSFETLMYSLMGVAAVVLAMTPVALAIAAFRNTSQDAIPRIVSLGMLLGSLVAFFGGAFVGGMMSEQPSHYPIDAEDRSSRLPFIGWSLTRDDLRIAHFVGLHALQGLIAVGLLLVRVPYNKAAYIQYFAATVWLALIVALVVLAGFGRSPMAWLPT